MLRILLPFLLGIRISLDYAPRETYTGLILIAGLLLMWPGAFHFGRFYSYRNRWIHGSIVYAAVFVIGLAMGNAGLRPGTASIARETDGAEAMLVRTCGNPRHKEGAALVFAEVEALIINDSLVKTRGKIRLRIRGDSLDFLGPHQRYVVPAQVDTLPARCDPGGFDYAGWLRKQGVYGLAYIDRQEMVLVEQALRWHPSVWGHRQQQRLKTTLFSMIDDSLQAGLAAAMLVGETSGLDEEISESFRRSGVVHILSVSGLHTGTVYAGIGGLLALFSGRRKRRKWMELIPLALVFMFALLTGLAPAVSRATLMISLHTASRIGGRRTEGINILAGAAFLMLMAKPFWLFNIGFNLSFLAVAGIMCLYTPAMAALNMNYGRWRKALGGLAIVSLVAQAGTAPLCLYSFHAFPLYFLPANLLTVPISTIAIYTGMVALPLELVGLPNALSVQAFSLLLGAMQYLSAWFSSLPGAYGEFIPFTMYALVFSYLILLLLVIPLGQGSRDRRLALLLAVTLLWGLARLADHSGKSNRRELWLIAGNTVALGEVNGRTARVISQDGQITAADTLRRKSWAMHLGIPLRKLYVGKAVMRVLPHKEVGEGDSLEYHIEGNRLILWCADPSRLNIPETVMPELVLITGKQGLRSLRKWNDSLRPDLLVLDGSARYLDEAREAELKARSRQLWVCSRQGSVQLE
jgi:competence protein ComEC